MNTPLHDALERLINDHTPALAHRILRVLDNDQLQELNSRLINHESVTIPLCCIIGPFVVNSNDEGKGHLLLPMLTTQELILQLHNTKAIQLGWLCFYML